MEVEIWRDVAGYEGLYQVSNFGRVKSLRKGGRIRKPVPDKDSYLQVSLHNKGKSKLCKFHRLAATAFIPNPLDKPQVNHIDGNPLNNRVSNLEWVTQSENMQHAGKTGLMPQGGNSVRGKLTNEDILYIRNNPDDLLQRQPAELLELNQPTISVIQTGKAYKRAGGQIRKSKRPRIPDEKREQIRHDRALGYSYAALAKMHGVDTTTVRRIINETN